jgi:predicted transcriptional regulator
MTKMARINKKKFITAMVGSGGILANIARKLDVSRQAVSHFVQKNKDIQDLLAEEDEQINDLAEAKLITKLNEGDMQAIKFRLTTKAKHRGYIERSEINYSGETTTTFKTDNLIDIWKEIKKDE